jgi:hypothetical protein
LARRTSDSGPKLRPTSDLAKQLIADRRAADPTRVALKLIEKLFPKQRQFVTSSERYIAGICSRRAGKTYAAAAMLLTTALLNPNSHCVYVSLARRLVKRDLWDDPVSGLLELNKHLKLGGEGNNSELTMRLPNGSRIELVGVDDTAQAAKLRGARYHLVIIDEAQNFAASVLEQMTTTDLPAALRDYQGKLVLLGTPHHVPVGAFYEITTGQREGWDVHHWTIVDNERFPESLRRVKEGLAQTTAEAALQIIDEDRRRFGWSEDNPKHLREDLGLWATDTESLLYKFDPARNTWAGDKLPEGHVWRHVLGVDFGSRDDTAFVVWAFSDTCAKAYQVFEDKRPRMHASSIVDAIVSLSETFDPEQIVVDPSAGGANYVEELRDRWGLPIEAAEKTKKASFIQLMNDDLNQGRLLVIRDGKLGAEWEQLEKDMRTGKERIGSIDHLSDAALYAWRYLNHHRTDVSESPRPVPGSPEYLAELELELMQRRNRVKKAHWEQGFGGTPRWQ